MLQRVYEPLADKLLDPLDAAQYHEIRGRLLALRELAVVTDTILTTVEGINDNANRRGAARANADAERAASLQHTAFYRAEWESEPDTATAVARPGHVGQPGASVGQDR